MLFSIAQAISFDVLVLPADILETKENYYSFDEVSTQFTSSGLILTVDNSSLNVEGTSLTSFHFADGTRTADFTNQTF